MKAKENEEVAGDEVNPGGNKNDGAVSENLTAEISGAVETVIKDVETERQKRKKIDGSAKEDDEIVDDLPSKKEGKKVKKKNLPPEKTPSGDESVDNDHGQGEENENEEEEEEKKGDEKPPIIPDSLVERAVRAGVSISDAKTFQSADALTRICTMLESQKANDKGGTPPKKEAEEEEDDPLKDVPSLDPKDYDEGVIKVVDALKAVIKDQHKKIKEVVASKSAVDVDLWFTSKVDALGDDYREVLGEAGKVKSGTAQAAMRETLKEKFNILSAGYKASEKEIDPATVFNEAVSMVLPDVAQKASLAKKEKEAADRERRKIQRPGGAGVKSASDPLAEVANAIDGKFFKK